MAEINKTGLLIGVFVMILLGAALIGTVSEQIALKTVAAQITSESVPLIYVTSAGGGTNTTYVYKPTTLGSTASDCPITGISLYNRSSGLLTETTDYVITDTTFGWYTLKNTNNVNGTAADTETNVTYRSYTYCPSDYLKQGWSRSVLNLVSGFFALAILLIGVGIAYVLLQEVWGK